MGTLWMGCFRSEAQKKIEGQTRKCNIKADLMWRKLGTENYCVINGSKNFSLTQLYYINNLRESSYVFPLT